MCVCVCAWSCVYVYVRLCMSTFVCVCVHACVVCIWEGGLCVHFSAINTLSNRTKTMVKMSREAMALMVGCYVRLTYIKAQLMYVFLCVFLCFYVFYNKSMMLWNFLINHILYLDCVCDTITLNEYWRISWSKC